MPPRDCDEWGLPDGADDEAANCKWVTTEDSHDREEIGKDSCLVQGAV